ncbi:MAG: hypothetical protein ACLFSM_03715 [Thermoplasmata archaeon]
MKSENIARIKEAKSALEEARADSDSLKLQFGVDSALEELEQVVE